MRQALLFIAAVVGMLAIVPLTIWAATGRWRDAFRAAKAYLLCLGLLAALALVGIVAGLIGSAPQ